MEQFASTSSSGITDVANMVNSAMADIRKPASDIPPFYTTVEGMFRGGLSPILLTSNIISRLAEAGIDAGPLPNGQESQIGAFVRIAIEEIVKEIQLNMKTYIEIPPGTTMGQAGPVPVVSTLPIQGVGINL